MQYNFDHNPELVAVSSQTEAFQSQYFHIIAVYADHHYYSETNTLISMFPSANNDDVAFGGGGAGGSWDSAGDANSDGGGSDGGSSCSCLRGRLWRRLKTGKIIMDKITIQKIGLAEIEQLQIIAQQTFFETFSAGNTVENMQKYLAEGFTIEKLTAELINPNAVFYFAQLDHQVIGYLKLNFGAAQTVLKDEKALEIERIYVLQEFHGKKVGQILLDTALDMAQKISADYLWLGVWEENPRAIHFYQKNGFVAFDKHIFILGDDEQTDIMMRLEVELV
jgi:ribosomal protein S18 acetylase RimI-like enzyme